MTDLSPDLQAKLRAQAEVHKCKAEEWQRDGRGLWAMRHCRFVGKHGHHEFTSWTYNVEPPGVSSERARQQGLIQKWRNRAEPNFADPEASEDTLNFWRGVKRCADELESAP